MSDLKPDHLIVLYLSNEASTLDQEMLFEWVSRSTENQRIFNAYVSAWSQQPKNPRLYNEIRALHKLNARIDAHEASAIKSNFFWNRWSIAAAIVLLIASGFVFFQTAMGTYEAGAADVLNEFVATKTGEKVTLTDGSVITLNAQAVLNYPEVFSEDARHVYLTGEAFFRIAKDSTQPFIIHTGNITTQVVGTSFNINTSNNRIVVSVATGSVKVSDGAVVETLVPYQKLTYEQNVFTKQSSDLSELNWSDRTLRFEDMPLEQVILKLEQYYEVKIVLSHNALKKCALTGKFTNEPLSDVLQAIEYSLSLKAEQLNNTITLSGNGCHYKNPN